MNGQISYTTDEVSTFAFGEVAIYLCDLGYSLAGGNRSRICLGDGTNAIGAWSGNEPHCEGESTINCLCYVLLEKSCLELICMSI